MTSPLAVGPGLRNQSVVEINGFGVGADLQAAHIVDAHCLHNWVVGCLLVAQINFLRTLRGFHDSRYRVDIIV